MKGSVGADLEAVKEIIGGDLENIKMTMNEEIAQLAAVILEATV